MKIIAFTLLLFVFSTDLRAADSPEAVNVLGNILKTKTLTLASTPHFLLQKGQSRDGNPSFSHMDLNTSDFITDFSFTAKLSSRENPTSVMAISASAGHVSVVVETTNGLPYCVMTDHEFVVFDPKTPGELGFAEGGTAAWGLFQDPDDLTNVIFQMSFIGTNIPPFVLCDVGFMLKSAFSERTNLSYDARGRLVTIQTPERTTEAVHDKSNEPAGFGIERLAMFGAHMRMDLANFDLHPRKNQAAVSKEALIAANLTLHEIKRTDLTSMQLLIPNGFPRTEAEEAIAKKLANLCGK